MCTLDSMWLMHLPGGAPALVLGMTLPKNIPNAQLPSRFAQALRSIRDLEQMGVGTMAVDEAQWKPHVHDAEEI